MTPDPALLIQPCSQWTSVWICFLPEKSAHFLHHKESSIISQFPLCLTCQLFESLSIASLYWKWALMGYMGYCWYLSWGSVHKLIWEHGRNKVQNKQTCKQIKCVCVCVHTHTRAHIFVCIYICVCACVCIWSARCTVNASLLLIEAMWKWYYLTVFTIKQTSYWFFFFAQVFSSCFINNEAAFRDNLIFSLWMKRQSREVTCSVQGLWQDKAGQVQGPPRSALSPLWWRIFIAFFT